MNASLPIAALACAALAAQEPARPVNYQDDVRPIFEERCIDCHRGSRAKNGFALHDYASLLRGGSSGAAIVPGSASQSLLWQLVTHEREPFMPYQDDRLDDAALATIRAWIEGGARETATSEPLAGAPAAPTPLALPDVPAGAAVFPEGLRQEPHAWSARGDAVLALAASPTTPLLAIGLREEIAFLHLETREPLGVLAFPEGRVHALAFSGDGSLLVAGGGRGGASGRAVVFDVRSGQRLAEIGAEPDVVLACDLTFDRALLALGGPDRVVRAFDVRAQRELYAAREHTDWITALGFSPDGVLLATADRAGGVLVREAWNGLVFHELPAHGTRVTALAWRADSLVLATATDAGQIRLYEMDGGAQIAAWSAHGGVLGLRFLADGRLVSCGRDARARVWDGAGTQLQELAATAGPATAVAATRDGSRIVVGDFAGRLAVYRDGAKEAALAAAPPTVLERTIERMRGLVASVRAEGEANAAERAASAGERAALEAALAALAERERRLGEREQASARRTAELEALLRALEERWRAEREAILARGGRLD